jgi:hypothetical protein
VGAGERDASNKRESLAGTGVGTFHGDDDGGGDAVVGVEAFFLYHIPR